MRARSYAEKVNNIVLFLEFYVHWRHSGGQKARREAGDG